MTEAAASPAPAIALKSTEFRRGREEGWRELETLVERVRTRGIRSLSAEELQRLPSLYRAAISSLSVARSIALDRNLLLYLENLTLRAFLAVYGPRVAILRGTLDFFREGFPAAVRTVRWHFLIAFAAVLVGVLAGFWLTLSDEFWFTAMVPSGLADDRGPASTRESLLQEEIFAPWPGAARAFGTMASFLFSHNTVVGILVFSLGIAAGVPTLLLLVYQGVIYGAFIALHYNRGIAVDFLGWTAIHGVTEFAAIMLCGAAGLAIAEQALFPGRYGRMENVALGGRSAAQIAIGAMLLFFVAAVLEGGFRQLVASTEARFAIGAVTGVLWLLYFGRAGRESAA
ncbi:MAG TPA: stage II sporulation protein M [Stellaceae bacterium]|nr:stage II sporulation protein M [Stellaceae bacterium]